MKYTEIQELVSRAERAEESVARLYDKNKDLKQALLKCRDYRNDPDTVMLTVNKALTKDPLGVFEDSQKHGFDVWYADAHKAIKVLDDFIKAKEAREETTLSRVLESL